MARKAGAFAASSLCCFQNKGGSAFAQSSRYDELAAIPYERSYLSEAESKTLLNELTFQRGVQTYLWALPALNMYGSQVRQRIKRAADLQEALNAKTLITTPNSDDLRWVI